MLFGSLTTLLNCMCEPARGKGLLIRRRPMKRHYCLHTQRSIICSFKTVPEWQNVGSDLCPNYLTLWCGGNRILKDFFGKSWLEPPPPPLPLQKKQQQQLNNNKKQQQQNTLTHSHKINNNTVWRYGENPKVFFWKIRSEPLPPKNPPQKHHPPPKKKKYYKISQRNPLISGLVSEQTVKRTENETAERSRCQTTFLQRSKAHARSQSWDVT